MTVEIYENHGTLVVPVGPATPGASAAASRAAVLAQHAAVLSHNLTVQRAVAVLDKQVAAGNTAAIRLALELTSVGALTPRAAVGR